MTILTSKVIWRREAVRRRLGLSLTSEQRANVRRALVHLHTARGREGAALALGLTKEALRKAMNLRRPVTMRLAVLIAYAIHRDVEDVLTGRWPAPNACPVCGRHD